MDAAWSFAGCPAAAPVTPKASNTKMGIPTRGRISFFVERNPLMLSFPPRMVDNEPASGAKIPNLARRGRRGTGEGRHALSTPTSRRREGGVPAGPDAVVRVFEELEQCSALVVAGEHVVVGEDELAEVGVPPAGVLDAVWFGV